MNRNALILLPFFLAGGGVVGMANAAVPDATDSSTTGGIAAISYVERITDALKTTLTTTINTKEDASNKTTTISSSSTDTQYPSAHAVYSAVSNRVDTSSSAVQTMAGKYTVSGSLIVPDQPLPTE